MQKGRHTGVDLTKAVLRKVWLFPVYTLCNWLSTEHQLGIRAAGQRNRGSPCRFPAPDKKTKDERKGISCQEKFPGWDWVQECFLLLPIQTSPADPRCKFRLSRAVCLNSFMTLLGEVLLSSLKTNQKQRRGIYWYPLSPYQNWAIAAAGAYYPVLPRV